MPDYVVGKVIDTLNEEGKSVKGSRILLLGLAYKANVDDTRETQERLEEAIWALLNSARFRFNY